MGIFPSISHPPVGRPPVLPPVPAVPPWMQPPAASMPLNLPLVSPALSLPANLSEPVTPAALASALPPATGSELPINLDPETSVLDKAPGAGPMSVADLMAEIRRIRQQSMEDTLRSDVNLVDPTTARRLKLETPFSDRLLELGPWGKLKQDVRFMVSGLPKAVMRGLRGDSNFTFTDFMDVAKIPYYLGGLCLVLSFRAGRDAPNAIRQGAGVLMYYLFNVAAAKLINGVYQAKDGVDLGMRFRRANGDIERVFASANMPRFDLLTEKHYRHMRQKMDIPDNVANPNQEVQDNLRRIISTSRADKLILGNLLAALGAGYLARSNALVRLMGAGRKLWGIWFRDPQGGNVANRLMSTLRQTRGLLAGWVKETVTGIPGESRPWLRWGVGLAGLASIATIVAHCMRTTSYKRHFESPLYTAVAPEMNPDFTRVQPSKQRLARLPGFALFEQDRANMTVTHPGGRSS